MIIKPIFEKMKIIKSFFYTFLVILVALIIYPFAIDLHVPLPIKILHYKFYLIQKFGGASLSSTFSRENVMKVGKAFSYIFPTPQHSNETIIERFKVKSIKDDYEIPVNIYINKSRSNEKPPTIVYIHGGGFVFAPAENLFYERFLKKGFVFVEIKYRLSPENKFPIALEDCYSAIKNQLLFKYSDMNKVVILGDSAGGNLVAALTYFLKENDAPLLKIFKFQVLVYPAGCTKEKLDSHEEYQNWYVVDKESMEFFVDAYAKSEEDYENPRFNLLKQKDVKGLPESYFILAKRDYLFSDGEKYAGLLKEFGDKNVTVKIYNAEHSFFKMDLYESYLAFEEMVEFLSERRFFD